MLQSRREKFLLYIVMLAVVVFVGTMLYQQMGETIFGVDDLIQDKKVEIDKLLELQEQTVEIQSRYDEMMGELTLEGSNPEQDAAIRKMLTDILNEVGLTAKYGSISPRDQKQEEDFKVASISIVQVQCTPQQLGQLLYRIEKQSKVMDVVSCRIDNLISEIGKPMVGRNRGGDVNVPPSGMLDVDLEIARLIEYRKGEKPKKRTR